MLNFTPIVRPYFANRLRQVARWDVQKTQQQQLTFLLKAAQATEIGRKYDFERISRLADSSKSESPIYSAFAKTVPQVSYEDIRQDVMRMIAGEADVLWRGKCRRYAQSSGTSGGKSKYIPVTEDSLRLNHYVGGADAVAYYLAMNPDSRMFSGNALILGGSFANELSQLPKDVKVGDLSANLIDAINPLVNLVRVPSKTVALMDNWEEKLSALVEASINRNITNISGVPSWFLTLLKKILDQRGVKTIHEVWPNLEVFFHGGIAFGPYREQYNAITDTTRMHYIENYNASEGFFAAQDTADPEAGMRLILDAGVFYEFLPLGATEPVPAWKVEKDKVYSLLISGSNGLWRYAIGDTVKIVSTDPLRIKIAGRTACYINAFGEELMQWNADEAIAKVCSDTNSAVANYTAGPVYPTDASKGRHQWIIEWTKAPADIEAFAEKLDKELQCVNSDYQAKRTGGLFLDRLSITTAPRGTFDQWLASTGKLGGQRKVPRLANDRHILDAILLQIKKSKE